MLEKNDGLSGARTAGDYNRETSNPMSELVKLATSCVLIFSLNGLINGELLPSPCVRHGHKSYQPLPLQSILLRLGLLYDAKDCSDPSAVEQRNFSSLLVRAF